MDDRLKQIRAQLPAHYETCAFVTLTDDCSCNCAATADVEWLLELADALTDTDRLLAELAGPEDDGT